ncbi:MAG TPA: DUF3800 domain-containing protein [Candidatus Angelobacter sp.]|nr:DUF3800 domain-containing protein [Candidatus Angelobacter sp.]
MILKFFCDESYNDKVLTLAGFMATEVEWGKLRRKWKSRVKKAGVSRFHAAPLNAYDGEFESWRGTTKSRDFVVPLLNIIKHRLMVGFSFAMLLGDYDKYTSPVAKDKLGSPYLCCFKHCIAMAAQSMNSMPAEDKFAVILDRNPEEKQARDLFGKIKDDSTVPYRHRLATCVAGSWEEYIPLQPADMIAYDTFKLLDDTHFHGKLEWRKSLKTLYASTPLWGKYFDKECFLSVQGKIESAEGETVIVEDQNDFDETMP